PEAGQASDGPERRLDLAVGSRPASGRDEVVQAAFESLFPRVALGTRDGHRCFPRESDVELGVTIADCVGFAARRELTGGEFAESIQEIKARLAIAGAERSN